MPVRISIEDQGLRGVTAWLGNIDRGLRRGTSTPALRRAAVRMGDVVLEEIDSSIDRRFRNRTGALSRSFDADVIRGTRAFGVAISSKAAYAAIQERGGVITPKTGPYLTVPLNAQARTRRAKDIQGLHRRGRALFLRNTAMYALARSVRIPATRYLSIALASAKPKIRRALRAHVRLLIAQSRR